VRQHVRVAHEASDAAIGVLKYDEVKLTAAPRNLSGNFADPPEHSQLLQQSRRNSTADITDHDGLSRLNSEYVSRVYAHIRATDDDGLYAWQRTWKRRHK
jgi:hypothetical protein